MNQVLWLFGLPSSGKTTIARALRDHLQASGRSVVLLDGDDLRSGLCSDLGFSDADRGENLRRAAHIAQLLTRQGHTVICAFVAPKEHHRALVRQILGDDVFLVHIDCPLHVCMARDVKGLYAKAAARQMTGMTGSPGRPHPPNRQRHTHHHTGHADFLDPWPSANTALTLRQKPLPSAPHAPPKAAIRASSGYVTHTP